MKNLIKIILVFFCLNCSNSNTEKIEYPTNLLEAKVSRITERLQVMIANKGCFAESRELITDNVVGYVGTRMIYDENGNAIHMYRGASEGLVSFPLYPKEEFLSSNEEYYRRYECKIDRNKNYIVDTAEPKPDRREWGKVDFVTDIIKDFVIIPKEKIILSKDDYKLLQEAKKDEDKMFGKRYILYRYK